MKQRPPPSSSSSSKGPLSSYSYPKRKSSRYHAERGKLFISAETKWGILCSVILSFALCLGLGYVLYYGVPLVIQTALGLYKGMFEHNEIARESAKTTMLGLSSRITVSEFGRYENVYPVLFPSRNSAASRSEFLKQWGRRHGGAKVSITNVTALDTTSFAFDQPAGMRSESTYNKYITACPRACGNNRDKSPPNVFAHLDLSGKMLATFTQFIKMPALPVFPPSSHMDDRDIADWYEFRREEKPDQFRQTFATLDVVKMHIGCNVSCSSGSSFHYHDASWNELLYGKKQWFLYPPSKFPKVGFSPTANLNEWLASTFAGMTDATDSPVEVIQEAGQVLYIPEGYYHATRTLSDYSISVSGRARNTNIGTFYHYVAEGVTRMHSKDYANAIKLFRMGIAVDQNQFALYLLLAVCLETNGEVKEAEGAYKQAIGQNRGHPFAYAGLINLLLNYASDEKRSRDASMWLKEADTRGLKEKVHELLERM
jgi:Cupin-like domain/Tetratricopeptide repeat